MIEVIPAIDLLDGRAVRLKRGDYNEVTDYGTPQDCAKSWIDQGAHRLHVVDLDGAREGKLVNLKSIEQILSLGVEIQVGGGIRAWDDLEHLFELGAGMAILGTVAVKDPDMLSQALHTYKERIILGLDARNGKVSIEGWLEDSEISAEDLLTRLSEQGLRRFIYTDILRDGAMTGPNIPGVKDLCTKFPNMKCVLSGGVSALEDFRAVAEQVGDLPNLEGIISGRALYENKFTLAEAQTILAS